MHPYTRSARSHVRHSRDASSFFNRPSVTRFRRGSRSRRARQTLAFLDEHEEVAVQKLQLGHQHARHAHLQKPVQESGQGRRGDQHKHHAHGKREPQEDRGERNPARTDHNISNLKSRRGIE